MREAYGRRYPGNSSIIATLGWKCFRTDKPCSVIFPVSFLAIFLLFVHLPAKAQSDSSSGNGYDTSGYYFNTKESASEKFTDKPLGIRVSSDSTLQKLKQEDDFWYVKSIEEFRNNAVRLKHDKKYRDSLVKEGILQLDEQVFTKEESSDKWYYQSWFYNLIWGLIIGVFAAAVIYFLMSQKINLFSRSERRKTEETVTPEDIFSIDYEALLRKYKTEKNYRLAVRILYLQLLKRLSERQLIHFQPQLTNTTYLQQLAGSNLYKPFFTVTRHYEYVWYGEFAINDHLFGRIDNDFDRITQQIQQA